jgi:hypothetical protein
MNSPKPDLERSCSGSFQRGNRGCKEEDLVILMMIKINIKKKGGEL